ncbi:MAG TPA: hypothetical protein VNY84_04305, partial [Acidimicrobiales bacterium]|nr:hypothetical protein [Acidimicrobiales bacterium]
MAAPTQARPVPPSSTLRWRSPAADRGRSGRQPGTSPLAEAALVGLTLAAAIDLGRLFRHEASFLGPVVL